MANRFPLIVDSSGVAALKELPSGDNLDLTGNGIVGAGTVALTNLTVGGSQGTDGQVLTSTGSGIAWEDAASGGGGGAWNVISSQTISSAVTEVEFASGITGYQNYCLVINNLLGSSSTPLAGQVAYNGSSSYTTSGYGNTVYHTNTGTSSLTHSILWTDIEMAFAQIASSVTPSQCQIWFTTGSSVMRSTFSGYDGSRARMTEAIHMNSADASSGSRKTSINKVKLYVNAGNMTSGTFTLYGLSNS